MVLDFGNIHGDDLVVGEHMKKLMEKPRLRKIILILGTFLVSIIVLLVGEKWIKETFFQNLFTAIGVSGITTGMFSIFSSALEIKNMTEIVHSDFKILDVCNSYGLKYIGDHFPFDETELEDDFINSKEVFVLMNDGKNFLSEKTFNKRIQKKEKKTNVILLNYDQEDSISVLTRKNGHDARPDYYKDKIKGVIEYHLKKDNLADSHSLKVYLNSNYNTLAIVMTDNYAMYSIYRVSTRKDEVPHFVFKKGGIEYEKIKNDLMKVCETSKRLI